MNPQQISGISCWSSYPFSWFSSLEDLVSEEIGTSIVIHLESMAERHSSQFLPNVVMFAMMVSSLHNVAWWGCTIEPECVMSQWTVGQKEKKMSVVVSGASPMHTIHSAIFVMNLSCRVDGLHTPWINVQYVLAASAHQLSSYYNYCA